MTSFSTYASRFLSSGAATASLQQQQIAPQSSVYRPFAASNHAGYLEEGEVEGEGSEDADVYGTAESPRDRRERHRFPHLKDDHTKNKTHNKGAKSSMAPSQSIPDLEDEDDESASHIYRDQRSRIAVPSGSSLLDDTPRRISSSNRHVHPKDEHDPFLAEDDLQRAPSRSTRSPSAQSDRRHKRNTSSEARAKGWMAHVGESSSAASAPSSKAQVKRRQDLPSDIYRDPDEDEDDDDDENSAGQGGQLTKGSDTRRDRYAMYDETETSDDTSDTSSEEGDKHQGSKRNQRKIARQAKISKAAGSIGSSLREPLLSSAGSERLAQPPGAFRGQTSRITSTDIYAYPHPDAKAGWTPWATGNRVSLSDYKDKIALLLWLALVLGTLSTAVWMILGANTVAAVPPSSPSMRPSPYYTLTRSIPILFLLTFVSLAAAAANLLLLRNITTLGGGHILRWALIGVPGILTTAWVWAFAGSFIYDDERWTGGGWSTSGLRLLSLLPLLAAILFARSVWNRRASLARSLSVLELSATIIAQHPALLALSLGLLFVFLAITAPFLFIFVRLFLIGHFGSIADPQSDKVWKTDSKARMMAWITLGAWLWSWSVLRGIQRVTVAGVISHWYFHRDEEILGNDEAAKLYDVDDTQEDEGDLPGPAPGTWLDDEQVGNRGPSQIEIVRASFVRATGPAIGTICLSALVLAIARTGSTMASTTRWINRKLASQTRFPAILQPMAHMAAIMAGLSSILQGFSDFTLVYVGITGDSFAAAARRSTRLVSRHSVKTIMEGLIINLILDLTTLALCFLAGLAGFLFSAHNLHVPADAPLVGLLCFLLPYWTLRLCADVLSNAADTLYLCFTIDEASGEQHCPKAAEAVSGHLVA